MTLATVTGLSAWILVGAFAALCGWAVLVYWDYRRICAEDRERTRRHEAPQVAPAFDFHIARRPVASTRSGRVVRATEGVPHGRNS